MSKPLKLYEGCLVRWIFFVPCGNIHGKPGDVTGVIYRYQDRPWVLLFRISIHHDPESVPESELLLHSGSLNDCETRMRDMIQEVRESWKATDDIVCEELNIDNLEGLSDFLKGKPQVRDVVWSRPKQVAAVRV